eukprot:gene13877-biopygen6297
MVRPSNNTNNATSANLSIALPESSTTITISTGGLSSSTAALVVTTVELGSGAVRFNASGNASTVPLPAPQLVSSVVTVQVKKVYSNGSVSPPSTEVIDVEADKARPSVQFSVKALLLAMLPPFFQHQQAATGAWWQRRWVRVLTARHPYARLLRHVVHGAFTEDVLESAAEAKEAILDVVYVLTALTMACFVLAVLFDFQYPEDDGSCALQTTEASCVSGKMLLDPLQSQCLWQPRSVSLAMNDVVLRQIVHGHVVGTTPITTADDTASAAVDCVFNGSNNSTTAFLLSFIITSIFANLLRHFLDWCFVVLTAHEQSADKAVDHEEDEKREETRPRQYSAAAVRQFCLRMQPSGVGRATRWHVDTHNVHEPQEVVLNALEVLRRAPLAPSANSTKSSRRSDEADAAVAKLRLALAEVLGSTGDRPDERHTYFLGLYRAFPEVVTLRHVRVWQVLVVLALLACNGGSLYYIIGKAAVRGFGWQVSFLRIALFEWLSEVVLLQSLEVWLFDYGLCWLVHREVEAAVQRIVTAADRADTSQAWSFSSTSSSSSSSSQRMSRRRPDFVQLSQPLSSRATGLVDRSAYRRQVLRLLSRGSLERWETVVSFVATLFLALLVYVFSLAMDAQQQTLTPIFVLGTIALVVALVVAVRHLHHRWAAPAHASATVTPSLTCDTADGICHYDRPLASTVDMAEIGLMGRSMDSVHRGERFSQPVLDAADDDGLSFQLSVSSADHSDDEGTGDDTRVQGRFNDEADCEGDYEGIADDIDDGEAPDYLVYMAARSPLEAAVYRSAAKGLSSYSSGDSLMGVDDSDASVDISEASVASDRIVRVAARTTVSEAAVSSRINSTGLDMDDGEASEDDATVLSLLFGSASS